VIRWKKDDEVAVDSSGCFMAIGEVRVNGKKRAMSKVLGRRRSSRVNRMVEGNRRHSGRMLERGRTQSHEWGEAGSYPAEANMERGSIVVWQYEMKDFEYL